MARTKRNVFEVVHQWQSLDNTTDVKPLHMELAAKSFQDAKNKNEGALAFQTVVKHIQIHKYTNII